MKKLWLLVVLFSTLGLLAFGPQATKQTAESKESKSAEKSEGHKKKAAGHPVDIDITLDDKGNPTAPDTTLHRLKDDRAHWNNKIKDQDCDLFFSPFGLPNHHIPHGSSATSGPIVAPDGAYEYVIKCGTKKVKKAKTGDPAILVTP